MHADSADAPYSTPKAPPEGPPAPVRRARLALGFAFAPVIGLGVGLFAVQVADASVVLGLLLGVGALLAAVGFGLGAHSAAAILPAGGIAAAGAGTAIGAILLSLVTAPLGALMAFVATFGFTRGRQLRQRGKLVFAEMQDDEAGWLPPARAPTAEAPAAVADAWRHNGLTEHASVAAFGRVAAELVALGAPAGLIESAYADALDEHRHTTLCFGLARDLDGRTLAPGPFPEVSALRGGRGPRAVRLANLAVESLVDGALNEGVSARVVAGLGKVTEDLRAREVLAEIARDEARHAAHGFDVMRWCLEAGGRPVAAALEAALSALPAEAGALPYDVENAERWGLPSLARLQAEYRTVRERTVARTRRLLDARRVAIAAA